MWCIKFSPICTTQHVPPHEKMSIIVNETPVMNMMVPCGAQTELSKCGVPRMCHFAVNEREPWWINCTECHIRPCIAMHGICRDNERNQNHKDRVGHRSIKCVKHSRTQKSMMSLVWFLIDLWWNQMFPHVHYGLRKVLNAQLLENMPNTNPSIPRVIWFRHQVQHPSPCKIHTNKYKSLGLHQVRDTVPPKRQFAVKSPSSIFLYLPKRGTMNVPVVVGNDDNLPYDDCKNATDEPEAYNQRQSVMLISTTVP